MVQIFAPLLWVAGLVVSVGLATPSKRTIDQFQQDITILTSQTDLLNSALDAFSDPGGTMAQLLVLYTQPLKHSHNSQCLSRSLPAEHPIRYYKPVDFNCYSYNTRWGILTPVVVQNLLMLIGPCNRTFCHPCLTMTAV